VTVNGVRREGEARVDAWLVDYEAGVDKSVVV
jgi:hypothetical protein